MRITAGHRVFQRECAPAKHVTGCFVALPAASPKGELIRCPRSFAAYPANGRRLCFGKAPLLDACMPRVGCHAPAARLIKSPVSGERGLAFFMKRVSGRPVFPYLHAQTLAWLDSGAAKGILQALIPHVPEQRCGWECRSCRSSREFGSRGSAGRRNGTAPCCCRSKRRSGDGWMPG